MSKINEGILLKFNIWMKLLVNLEKYTWYSDINQGLFKLRNEQGRLTKKAVSTTIRENSNEDFRPAIH